jgi:hypothetical protein
MTTKGLGLRLGWRIQINIRCDGKNISQLGNGTPAAMVRAQMYLIYLYIVFMIRKNL